MKYSITAAAGVTVDPYSIFFRHPFTCGPHLKSEGLCHLCKCRVGSATLLLFEVASSAPGSQQDVGVPSVTPR